MRVGADWKELPTLTSERLVLRMLRADDAERVYEVFRDPDVMRYWSSPPMKGAAEAQELIRHIQDSFDSRTLFQWGIASRSTDEILGTCTLFRLDLNHGRCEIGFAIGKQHWGQGIASEAVARLIRFAFEEFDLHRIEADVDPRNERSLRLLERHSFRREGLLRERYRVGDEIQDTVFLGLLRREWERGKPDSLAPNQGWRACKPAVRGRRRGAKMSWRGRGSANSPPSARCLGHQFLGSALRRRRWPTAGSSSLKLRNSASCSAGEPTVHNLPACRGLLRSGGFNAGGRGRLAPSGAAFRSSPTP